MDLLFTATALADRNEFANAPYIGAEIAKQYFVPARWCTSATLRGYAIHSIVAGDAVATHETALWIHTGQATPALARGLALADHANNKHGQARRSSIPAADCTHAGGQRFTTAERTAVDLLLRDITTGIPYLLSLLREYPALDIAAVQECAGRMRVARGIRTVREALAQLAQTLGENVLQQRSTRES
ncbi:MAG: hypothetical protein MR006_05380 [Arcanobacterium sp.]|nr:hypothetical protein [Arcanobacterium sp.]